MALTDAEWDLVACLVRDHVVGSTIEPLGRLRQIFPADIVGALPLAQTTAGLAREVVTLVRNSGLGGDEPLPLLLLRHLVDDVAIRNLPDRDKVAALILRLEAEKAALQGEDVFRATRLSGNTEIFINRQSLRPQLEELFRSADRFVLRVKGEADTGKSHTFSLIQHVAERCRFRPAYVVVSEASTAEDVVRDLALYVGDGSYPPRLDDHDKWIGLAARTIVTQASASGVAWWFVVDQCNDLTPRSDVVQLILRLAEAVDNISGDVSERRPRLVLLGYGDDLPPMPHRVRNKVRLDETYRLDSRELSGFLRPELPPDPGERCP